MNREYQEAMRARMEREANGEPTPPEIAEKMTKPKEQDALWQVMVTVRKSKKLVPLGPMMCADACGLSVAAINKQILSGQRWDWLKAEAYPMTPISEGAN